MRTLIFDYVYESLSELYDEEKETVETILDLDMGYWSLDNGPLLKPIIKPLLTTLTDSELLQLYDFLHEMY
jgi:hypothetical protein